jgi:fatty-acyl-CoA synthase
VGQRLPYQHVKAVDIDDTTGAWIDRPPGEAGVLAISGPTVFAIYLVETADGPVPDATGKVVDGWLDTGDLARVDADGYIYLAGRAKDLIIRGGHNIDPAVVEDALLEHPAVTSANSVGLPDKHAGEVPVAYVTVAAGSDVTEDELVGWAGAHVPEKASAPKFVTIVDALPLTAVGKPYKPELRRDATERAVAAELGVDGVRAELVGGAVIVSVPSVDGRMDEITAALDAYAITWRFD